MSAANVELVKAAVEAFNRRDVEWMSGHCASDFEWHPAIAGGVTGKPYRGQDGLRTFSEELVEVWEEFRLEPEEVRDLGDHILVLAQVRAKGKAGVVFEQSLDAVWKVRDGQLVKGRSFLSRDEALRGAAEAAERKVIR